MLAEIGSTESQKKKKVFVAYRDSTLTWYVECSRRVYIRVWYLISHLSLSVCILLPYPLLFHYLSLPLLSPLYFSISHPLSPSTSATTPTPPGYWGTVWAATQRRPCWPRFRRLKVTLTRRPALWGTPKPQWTSSTRPTSTKTPLISWLEVSVVTQLVVEGRVWSDSGLIVVW